MAASLRSQVLGKNTLLRYIFHIDCRVNGRKIHKDVWKQCRMLHSASVYSCSNKCATKSSSASPLRVSSRLLHTSRYHWFSTAQETTDIQEEEKEEYHSIIKDTERGKGPADKHDFQAETRKLLDIVARSLYSEREVFIRELISNASDALEKLRYLQATSPDDTYKDVPLEIHIAADENKKTFTIQDTGVGLTKEELIENLGTIARSGSKAFLSQIEGDGASVDRNIIGQFGVGFYSAFMVADKISVYTQSHKPESQAWLWTSDGMGSYEVKEAEGVQRGTKIVLHLKGDCYDYAKEEVIKEVIKKYSNFVGAPIYLNGKKVNVIQPLWTMEPRDITDDMHEEFYRFVANAYDKPRYHLHYKTDAPLNIRALFYVPEYKPTLFDMSRETEVQVTLYSKKVMIMSKATNILPRWLRFVKGVVDSEDIPLNLSRELLQDSALLRKLRWVLTNRLLKFFLERMKKDKEKYLKFYDDYGLFFREGIVTSPDQEQREEISKLLRFESSKLPPGEKTGLDEYVTRMDAGARVIYYFSAPSRQLAETSPYFEAMKEKDIEVLFCFEPYDELVLMNLGQFDKKNLKSIENELIDDKSDTSTVDAKDEASLTQEQAEDLMGWLQVTLGNKINKTKITKRLASHPCVITVTDMGAARHFLKTAVADQSDAEKYRILQPTLEINPTHPIMKKLYSIKSTDSTLARLVAEQVYDNAMIAAGLVDDPRTMVNRLNDLLSRALEKH